MGWVSRFRTARWAQKLVAALAALPALLFARLALAEEAHDWQLGMQPAATPIRHWIDQLHHGLLIIITLITIFVLALLLYVMVRFREARNPVASMTTHHTLIEVLWTVLPVVILVGVAIFSFPLLYYQDRVPGQADMTLKVTGHQWYWTYEYPDQGGLTFDSYMIPEEEAVKTGKKRLLSVDNPVVLPVGAKIRVLVAGSDVIHSWYMPSFGFQEYSMVGRVNESWIQVDREGTFYGQCNQICGVNHPFMPIEVRVVSKEAFAKWVDEAKKKFASNDNGAVATVAANDKTEGRAEGAVRLAAAAAQ